MEEVTARYRSVITLLEQEMAQISGCLQGEPLNIYREMLNREVQTLKNELRQILQQY